jgi:peroxiredoxin Q/BCP
MIKPGEAAPVFCLPNQEDQEICLKDFRGRWVVLYFYPRDNTQGCTLEGIDFSASLEKFHSLNTEVMGISPDSPESHSRFRVMHDLTVILLSDPEHQALEAYGVWGKKMHYGKSIEGVIRSTFLIDPDGILRVTWPSVKVKGHVEEVLSTLREEIRLPFPGNL